MSKVRVYSSDQEASIKADFDRLKGSCYLDHAGATLYSEKQLQAIFADLSKNIYSNPHARSTSSETTIDIIDIVRYRILKFFKASPEEYSVIFTSGATQSLKLIAESFSFHGGSLVYLEDNHTSVLGMRSFAPNSHELKVRDAFNILSGNPDVKKRDCDEKGENCLFVYPAQSNFAGTKFPLSWIEAVKDGALNRPERKSSNRWYCLLDAACFAATNNLDLGKFKPDFVAISFYKLFGYPTGLGAILVRRTSEDVLVKKYYGGGTVFMALSSEDVMIPRVNIHERFEDGTIPFLSIVSLLHGFEALNRLQLTQTLISKHTFNLGKYIFERLSEMCHSNGSIVAVLYHDSMFESIDTQGGIVNFNLKRSNGDYVGYAEVLHIANLHGIQLRTGCFCNPGACHKFLKITSSAVRKHFEAGHVCGDQHDLVDGYPTGSVRISFGYMSTFEEADKFLRMIETCFVTLPLVRRKQAKHGREDQRFNRRARAIEEDVKAKRHSEKEKGFLHHELLPAQSHSETTGELVKIYLYPVKSCGALEVTQSWKLTDIGLEYDRRWMIVNASGSCVSQKQIKTLCTLKPTLDFVSKTLILKINGSEMAVPLELAEEDFSEGYFCNSKVCGDKVQGFDCGNKVAEWLSDNLEHPGLRLLRQCDFTPTTSGRNTIKGEQTLLSLANKAEYLLVNLATVRWLRERIPQEDVLCHSLESVLLRFRANFVVDFTEPFVENDLAILLFNDVTFKFSGHCVRCQMICIDQQTGETSKEPLQTLSREMQGKMRFGIYLNRCHIEIDRFIQVGSLVQGFRNC
ncbi:molybdenum cofactor sulfurase 2 isoform X1 [Euwallacea similis]|uniref:molybdenum cofactor sulfurase 2 isoform X1 n=2 Tax=Euwallacea similis TaxID=1736056 RepID=UPI00344B658A